MKVAVITFLTMVVVASASGVTTNSFERYQSIVDRQMFGALPPNFDPSKSPNEVAKASKVADKEVAQQQEQIKKAIRFMAINRDPDGSIRVGFADNANPKLPMTYYVKVGEQAGPWTVKSADIETAGMTIVNGEGVEVTLKLGGDSSTDTAAVSQSGVAEAAGTTPSPRNRLTLFGGGNLRERRRLMEEQSRARAAEEAKAREEREAEREKQRAEERASQQAQILSIQDELRRVREERDAAKAKDTEESKSKEVEL